MIIALFIAALILFGMNPKDIARPIIMTVPAILTWVCMYIMFLDWRSNSQDGDIAFFPFLSPFIWGFLTYIIGNCYNEINERYNKFLDTIKLYVNIIKIKLKNRYVNFKNWGRKHYTFDNMFVLFLFILLLIAIYYFGFYLS